MLPTINSSANIEVLTALVQVTEHLPGEIWECGVYKGGSAAVIRNNSKKVLRLFDTFGPGMPTTSEHDVHQVGEFTITYKEYTDIVDYFNKFPNTHIHKGFIPETFKGLDESVLSLVHIDVDQYQVYLDIMEFCYPKLVIGGVFVFDDYRYVGTPGATKAVNEFCNKYNLVATNSDNFYGGFLIKL